MVDKKGTHAVITTKDSFDTWTIYRQVDRRDGGVQNVYQCPKENCKFLKL
jgi:hypothetical protein